MIFGIRSAGAFLPDTSCKKNTWAPGANFSDASAQMFPAFIQSVVHLPNQIIGKTRKFDPQINNCTSIALIKVHKTELLNH